LTPRLRPYEEIRRPDVRKIQVLQRMQSNMRAHFSTFFFQTGLQDKQIYHSTINRAGKHSPFPDKTTKEPASMDYCSDGQLLACPAMMTREFSRAWSPDREV